MPDSRAVAVAATEVAADEAFYPDFDLQPVADGKCARHLTHRFGRRDDLD